MLTSPHREWSRRLREARNGGRRRSLLRPWWRIARVGACALAALAVKSAPAQTPQFPPLAHTQAAPAGPVLQIASSPLGAPVASQAEPQLEQAQYFQSVQPVDGRMQFLPRAAQELEVIQHRSQLINTTQRVRRVHISDPSVLEVIQFSQNEFSLIGLGLGTTDLTFWFESSSEPLMYSATVIRDPALEEQRRIDYGKIERKLALLYPNSKVYLIPMSQKIVVRGQARDAEEAARIMQIVRGEVLTQEGDIFGGYQGGDAPNVAGSGRFAVEPTAGYGGVAGGDLLSSLIVNELQIPGEFQVMLRVRIADLNRSQLRRMGMDWQVIFNDARHIVTQTFAAAAPVLTGIFENGEVSVLLDFLASNGSAKILEDSVVVTMSGNPASFLSGGEFAVPNTVGNNGVLVGTTTFRGFGTSIIATPTVVDDDLIRLQIVPELSAINSGNAVGGVPGVDVRRVQTVVELREGQTIVLGGLFSRRQQAEVTRIPLLGEIPIVGTYLFNTKQATEDETELLIVVTPEIVRPMDPEEVPPLPGFYVTHPDDFDLYKLNRTEGNPDLSHYRLLPYGNGQGYGENAGFGYHNPPYDYGANATRVDTGMMNYSGEGAYPQGEVPPAYQGFPGQPGLPMPSQQGYPVPAPPMSAPEPTPATGFSGGGRYPAPQYSIQQTGGQQTGSRLSPANWFRRTR